MSPNQHRWERVGKVLEIALSGVGVSLAGWAADWFGRLYLPRLLHSIELVGLGLGAGLLVAAVTITVAARLHFTRSSICCAVAGIGLMLVAGFGLSLPDSNARPNQLAHAEGYRPSPSPGTRPAPTPSISAGSPAAATDSPGPPVTGCIRSVFQGVLTQKIGQVTLENGFTEVGSLSTGYYGVELLGARGEFLGAIRLNHDEEAEQFRIEQLVDGRCNSAMDDTIIPPQRYETFVSRPIAINLNGQRYVLTVAMRALSGVLEVRLQLG